MLHSPSSTKVKGGISSNSLRQKSRETLYSGLLFLIFTATYLINTRSTWNRITSVTRGWAISHYYSVKNMFHTYDVCQYDGDNSLNGVLSSRDWNISRIGNGPVANLQNNSTQCLKEKKYHYQDKLIIVTYHWHFSESTKFNKQKFWNLQKFSRNRMKVSLMHTLVA